MTRTMASMTDFEKNAITIKKERLSGESLLINFNY